MTDPTRELVVFTLGGTIASVPDGDGRRAKPTLSADDLVGAVPPLRAFTGLRARSFRQYPSGDLGIDDILALSREIDALATSGVDGFVVTQGTDTLEESAFLLDLVTGVDVPVVVTGAMRNAGLPGADGPANLLAAVQVAASDDAAGLGALVVFDDEIHAARFVRKTHTASTGTFRSLPTGPIGWINEGRVRIPLVPRRRTRPILVPEGAQIPDVALVRLSLGSDARLIECVAQAGYRGAVVEVYGGGHASRRVNDALDALVRKMPVVFASRTGAGELYTSTYSFPGSEEDLLARGLVSAGALDGLKSRLLLTVLIAAGADRQTVEDRFAATVA